MLEFFYRTHDPTTKNQQGKDVGTRAYSLVTSSSTIIHIVGTSEYRSAIFYHTPEQLEIAKRVTEEVQKKHFDPIGMYCDCPPRIRLALMQAYQAKRSPLNSSPRASGGMRKTTTRSTSSRTPMDTNVLITVSIGEDKQRTQRKDNTW